MYSRAFHLVHGFGFEATAPLAISGGTVHLRNLLRVSIKRHHFAGFALDADFERPTANFAIRCETLIANRRVELQVEATSTEGALNLFGQLHTGSNCKKDNSAVIIVQLTSGPRDGLLRTRETDVQFFIRSGTDVARKHVIIFGTYERQHRPR